MDGCLPGVIFICTDIVAGVIGAWIPVEILRYAANCRSGINAGGGWQQVEIAASRVD